MNVSVIQGRGKSKGFPNKNIRKIFGHPLMAYPLMAARDCKLVSEVWFTTDSKKMATIAHSYGANTIIRPVILATDEALSEDVFVHAYEQVKDGKDIGYLILLFANAIGVTTKMIEEMILILDESKEADSICTISEYKQYSPYRMRKIDKETGFLKPFVDYMDFTEITCDRDSGEVPYIYDCCCAVVKPKCLDDIELGAEPQKWLGNRTLPYIQPVCPIFDIDYKYQLSHLRYWLRQNKSRNIII